MQHKTQRTGPRPLWLHLNGGAAMMAAVSENEKMFTASSVILQEALAGVRQYQESSIQPYYRRMKTVAEANGSKIITGENWRGNNVVLLIPSLINGWHIFDIEEQFSFAAHIYEKGICPLIVEWAEPTENNISLADYITDHLKPLIDDVINKGYKVKGLAGYCMGGTIIAALLSAFPKLKEKTGRNVLIAPPWDFSYQPHDQFMRLQTMAMQTHVMSSPVPTDFVQALFWAIDPLQVLKKFRNFPAITNQARFVRVEDWLNEGRPVSLSVIRTCLFDWYRDNAIAKGHWSVNGVTVTASALQKETMIVTGKRDNLVPRESADPLFDQCDNAVMIEVDTGHIGLMASDKSVASMWNPVAEFLK